MSQIQLNDKQAEAKNKIDGPLLIIAGAWSGKTATLTARVEYMIREKGIVPSNIMMVTFTNKAASEMRERVATALWVPTPRNLFSGGNFPTIGTFHSIWIFILKNTLKSYGDEIDIGLKNDFVIYDETDKLSVIKGIIKNDLNLDEKEYKPRQVGSYISNAKSKVISAKWYEKEIDNAFKEVVWQAYTRYEKILQQNNAIDFDDILIKTLHILQGYPQILDAYQNRYQYLMVDEYQDTNKPQYEIVKLLAEKYKNLAVVWDDSQSIYSWRWADMTNIINFKKDYSDALVIKLEQNYRSTKNIISAANHVIKNNKFWMKKELWTDNIQGTKINYIEAPDDKIEARVIVDIIADSITHLPLIKGVPEGGGIQNSYSDNLILYRTNAQSRKIEEALMSKNVPYRVIWGLKFYDRKEIKDLLAYLRVIHNSSDVVSMKRVINTPTRKIGTKSIEILDNYKESFGISYSQIISNISEVEELKPAAKSALDGFWKLLSGLIDLSHKIPVNELLSEIVKQTEYINYITDGLPQEEKDSKKENIDEIINLASEYTGMEPRESLATFLEEVALLTDMDSKDERSEYVTLMTIHTSKWLEEKTVFVTGMEDGIFPSFRSVNESNLLEEERRLMYVAMTRAREHLYMSRCSERFHFWDYVRNPESRFMKEVPEEYIESYDLWNSSMGRSDFFWSSSKLEFNSLKSNPQVKIVRKVQENNIEDFHVGDRVEHIRFGTGFISELNGEIADIIFSGKWKKKMNIKIAPVKKV